MKSYLLLPFLFLLAQGLFAQREPTATADKTPPTLDPHQLQGPPTDTEPPVVVCLNGLNTNIPFTLWASDLLQSVTDNETPAAQIKIGIRAAGTGTGFPWDANGSPQSNVNFNCSHLGPQSIELWAIDLAGNADYCEASVTISDNLGVCSPDTVVVCLHKGCDGAPMPGVPVFLDGTLNFQPPFSNFGLDSVTDINGCAHVLVPGNLSAAVIVPGIDDAPLNGVTTYDLLLIAKHILGLEPLDNPYKMIAADANKSGSITSFDLVELRKLLLGIYQELPNNTSWRFVDAAFEFPNLMNPFSTAFPEVISFNGGSPLPDSLGFVGVKIGDLDCSAVLNGAPVPDYPDAFFAMPDTFIQSGLDYSIPVFMAENGTWQGYQFSLNFDPQKLEFQAISYNGLSGPSNWNILSAAAGTLTTSWTQLDVPGGFGPNFPFATFHFHALQSGSLQDIMKLNPLVHSEAYTGVGAEKRDLLLTFVPQFKPAPGNVVAEKLEQGPDPTVLWDYAAPKLSCINGLSVNVLPTGMINLWATDFLLSVSDNVTPTNFIQLGLRKAGAGTGFPTDFQGNALINTLFTCNELGTQGVELWARDLAGNTAHCETYVIVQDNLGNCNGQNPTGSLVRLCARTEQTDHVEEMTFSVVGQNPNGPFFANDLTDQYNDGCVYFEVPMGSDIVATPVKDDNPLNGVTTFDLVLISKHIQGIEPLNSPYKIIAADADRNGIVDSTDIDELWKLIIGVYTELPNNTSWRFVDKGYTFPNANNPFETVFPESLVVQNIQAGAFADFTAIKVGDVNGTAIANILQQEPEERTDVSVSSSAIIGQPNPNPTAGSATIPVYLSKPETMQLELSDLTGKVLWSNELSLESGSHALEIPALALPGAVVYVWRIQLGTACKAGKLIRL